MYEKMKEMIAERLSIEEEKITPDARFVEDLDADSLDLFDLVMALEDEYDIEIPTEDLEQLTTVGSFIDYLREMGIE